MSEIKTIYMIVYPLNGMSFDALFEDRADAEAFVIAGNFGASTAPRIEEWQLLPKGICTPPTPTTAVTENAEIKRDGGARDGRKHR